MVGTNSNVLNLLLVLDVLPNNVHDVRDFNCLPLLYFLDDLGRFWWYQWVPLLAFHQ